MILGQRRSFAFRIASPLLAAFCVINLSSNVASASNISIAISVVDLVFDGKNLVDAGSPAFGTGNIADADPVDSMVFQVDGSTVGILTSPPEDLGVDIYIPLISAIPSTGGVGTSAAGGTFDLLMSAAVPGYGLELILGPADIIYSPIIGIVDFVFVGAVAGVGAQDLPFALEIGDPISVTLSTQASSISSEFGSLSGFTSSGTGEVTGEKIIPEPSTLLLGGLALLCAGMGRRRYTQG
jgi:hypothetical protein